MTDTENQFASMMRPVVPDRSEPRAECGYCGRPVSRAAGELRYLPDNTSDPRGPGAWATVHVGLCPPPIDETPVEEAPR